MKFIFVALLTSLAPLAWAQDTPLTAIPYSPSLDLSSMNRAVDPCTDFYQYACGSWIKNNPIPPDQARWNVYSKLATENQRFLWGILEQAAKPSPTRTPVEAEIGDYFYACMDEAAREKAGAAPLQAELDKVAALKSLNDLAAFLAHTQLTTAGSQFLFGFGSGQDFADSSRVIAFLGAGGLGLPDRDYYTKTDAKSVEIRAALYRTRPKDAGLLGEPAAQAKTDAQTVMSIETALAKASLTRVEKRDPYKLFHPFTLAKLQQLTPLSPGNPISRPSILPASRRSTSPSPRSSAKSKRNSKPAASTIGKLTCAGTWPTPRPRYSPPPSSPRISISTATTCAASKPCSPCGSAACSASMTTWAKPSAKCS